MTTRSSKQHSCCTFYTVLLSVQHRSYTFHPRTQFTILKLPWSRQRDSSRDRDFIRNTMQDIDGDKNLHEIYHAWAQPMHGRFLKMNRESRFEGGHRPKIEIQGSSCRNICRRRDPKCYFDLIPKRKIKNQWKKLETKIPHGVFH